MKLSYHNTASLMRPHKHGTFVRKDMIVLHETVSGNIPGWSDINAVESYLAGKDYGIHGMTDADGNIAWAYGLGDAIFWQAGGVNERSIGIEQVSRVMLAAPTTLLRRKMWAAMQAELRATAKLIAAISNSRRRADGSRIIPLRACDGLTPGITTHYQVSRHFRASEGHTDCFPVHLGGYYPLFEVVQMARNYAKLGYKL